MQKTLELHLTEAHAMKSIPSPHTGVFLDSSTKLGSIGVQVRHRLTSHGFALNITQEPVAWFDQVVACGLTGVKAGCVELSQGRQIRLEEEIPGLVSRFGRMYERDLVPLKVEDEGEIGAAITALEEEAELAGDWHKTPVAA
jgi:lipoyl(octanoyl) transferase